MPPRPGVRHRRLPFPPVLLLAVASAGCADAVPTAPPPCDGPTSGPLCLRPLVTGLEFPIHVAAAPGADWFVVVEQKGLARVFDGDTLRAEPFLDLQGSVRYPQEQGLLGLVFDPAFEVNRTFYAHYTNLEGDNQVSRFRVGPDARVADRGSEERLLTIPGALGLHNGGALQIDPDGHLWVATGDGYEPENAQDLGTSRGSILRVDPQAGAPAPVPPDNPFVASPGARPEIWMYGLRNPYGLHLDLVEGLAYVADVGHLRREELNVLPWRSPGANFGWPLREGSLCNADGCDAVETVAPVHEYGHDEGCALLGGVVYRGAALPDLTGHYVHVDFCGYLRSLRYRDGAVTAEREWFSGELGQLLALTAGPGGEMFLLGIDGTVWRVEPAP